MGHPGIVALLVRGDRQAKAATVHAVDMAAGTAIVKAAMARSDRAAKATSGPVATATIDLKDRETIAERKARASARARRTTPAAATARRVPAVTAMAGLRHPAIVDPRGVTAASDLALMATGLVAMERHVRVGTATSVRDVMAASGRLVTAMPSARTGPVAMTTVARSAAAPARAMARFVRAVRATSGRGPRAIVRVATATSGLAAARLVQAAGETSARRASIRVPLRHATATSGRAVMTERRDRSARVVMARDSGTRVRVATATTEAAISRGATAMGAARAATVRRATDRIAGISRDAMATGRAREIALVARATASATVVSARAATVPRRVAAPMGHAEMTRGSAKADSGLTATAMLRASTGLAVTTTAVAATPTGAATRAEDAMATNGYGRGKAVRREEIARHPRLNGGN